MMREFSLNSMQIERHVGARSFDRGMEYFEDGNVVGMTSSNNVITGSVWGTSRKPYQVVILTGARGIVSSECTCPMETACKHVATLALAAQKSGLTPTPTQSSSAISQTLRRPIQKRPAANWRTVLKKTSLAEDEESAPRYDLELVFDLIKTPRPPWDQRGGHETALRVRPRAVERATGTASWKFYQWKDVRVYENTYKVRENLVPRREAKFCHEVFECLETHIDYSSYAPTSPNYQAWMFLREKSAEQLWQLLSRHGEYGIALKFGEETLLPLKIGSEPLTPTLVIDDVDDDTGKDGVMLRHGFFSGDEELPADATLLRFGNPPALAFVLEHTDDQQQSPQAVFFSVKAGVDNPLLLALKNAIRIPANDLKEFSATHLPRLMRQVAIKSLSTQITLPQRLAPRLKIAVGPAGTQGILIDFFWSYGDAAEVPASHPADIILGDEAANRRSILRDPQAEARVWQKARKILEFTNEDHGDNSFGNSIESYTLQKHAAAHFIHEIVPQLQRAQATENIIVAIAEDTPAFEISKEEVQASLEVADPTAGEMDWFDLQISLRAGTHEITLQEVLPALKADEPFLFLADGTMIDLSLPVFVKLKKLMEQAAHLPESTATGLKVSRFQAGWWEELQELGVIKRQAKAWQDSMDGLLAFKSIEARETPATLQATLRPYQKEGAAWLMFLRDHHLGGVLADDMGLGKTVQSIALICDARSNVSVLPTSRQQRTQQQGQRRPFLIIAPTSVVENWALELERFAPSLKTVVLRRGNRSELHRALAKSDVVVTSYALVARDFEILAPINWDTIIADEAQAVKNHQSKTYTLIRRLQASCRLALTGTPLENNLMELWAIMSLVAPGLFPPPERFREHFQRPIEKLSDGTALRQLRQRIRPFLLRRTRDIVQKELPAKTEQVLFLEMSKEQREFYELLLHNQRQKVLGLLATGGLRANRFEILTALMRLRQACLDASLVQAKARIEKRARRHQPARASTSTLPSVKLDTLTEQLESIISEGHKVLVFSQFVQFLSLVRGQLEQRGVRYEYLDGSTRDRARVIREFQTNPACSLLLMSLKAGGVGLNITAADYCILLDPWWNPAVESQAIARVHRLGQKRHVTVYKYIIKDSIEEKVLKLQERKKKLFTNILDDGEAFTNLITEDDIRALFTPDA